MKALKLDKIFDQSSFIGLDHSNINDRTINPDSSQVSSTTRFRFNKILPEPQQLQKEKDYNEVISESHRDQEMNLQLRKSLRKINSPPAQKKAFSFEKMETRRISFAKLTENFGKITKNAVHEFKDSVKQVDFKEEYRKGLEKALNFLDINSSRSPLLKFIKTFIFFNIQIFIFLMNSMSIINLVLVMDYRLGDFSTEDEPSLKTVEWVIGAFFSLEVLLEIFFNYQNFWSIFTILLSVGNILNILLMLEIVYSTLYIENFKNRLWIWVVIGFLRSLKLIKLRRVIEFNVKQFRKIIENNKISIEIISNEEEELKFSVIGSVCDILVGIFIEATALLSINEILNFEAFTNPGTFTYIGAAYYAIVSLTTIGYGDVTPAKFESRIFIEIMLFFNISVLSTFIGNLTERMSKLSPFVKNFSYKNHVVIIGDIPITFLQFFIEEINEYYIIQSRLNVNKQNWLKIIVVGKNNPSREFEHWMLQFSAKETNGYVDYLKSNITENKWYKQANLQYCKHLFAFSINIKDSESVAFEKDKQLAFNIQNIISDFPELPVTLTLTTDFENNIHKDSLWKNVQTVPFRLLNDFIMANSLENQGFNTWLVHLFTMREKKEPLLRESKEKSLMADYSMNMRQEIYPIRLPNMFIGKTFIEAARIMYFSSVDYLEFFLSRPDEDNIRLKSSETSQTKKQFALQLIAIQVKSSDPTSKSNKILVNPINHVIKADEIGYVIAVDQESCEKVSNFTVDSPAYLNYMRNVNLMRKVDENKFSETGARTSDLIKKIIGNLENNYNNWRIDEESWKATNPMNPILKSFQNFEVDKNEQIPSYFNLFLDNSPKGLFKNHLIIKGNLNEVVNIAYIVRFYSERPILLFTDYKINYGIWAKLRANYNNIFCVFGNPMLVKHVENLDPRRAYKILILSSCRDELIQDSSSVIFARILEDFFETPNFLVELMDENNIKFISPKPKLTLNSELDYFFWPIFARGSVHFSSLIMSILARTISNKYWVDFLKNLAKPEEKDLSHSHEDTEYSNIQSFEITKEIAQEIQIYGHLQYFLLHHSPPITPIALLKEKAFINENKRKRIAKISLGGQKNKLKGMLAHHFLKTMDDLYHYCYLMTNPTFMTSLDAGDKVLVLGLLQKNGEKKPSFVKENKIIPKIKVYLNKNSIDRENLKKEEERKRIVRFFRERKKVWRNNERRVEYKEKLSSLLYEANKLIKFALENYKNVFRDNEEEEEEDEEF